MKHVLVLCTLVVIISATVIPLSDENSGIVFKGEWFIKAYAPWCGACKSIAPKWTQLGAWAADKDYNIAEIDITAGYTFSNQLLVTRIPTLFHVKDGVFTQYQGSRQLDSFKNFLTENESEKLVPMAWYRRPGSITMAVFGYLMAFALKVHDMHNYLNGQYNIPVPLSVLLLIMLPILLIIVLVLVGISLVHFIWGKPKPAQAVGPQRARKRTLSADVKHSVEEETVEEEIVEEETVEDEAVKKDQ